MTIWGRLRKSRVALWSAALVATTGPIYLALAFPFIWDRQMALMQTAKRPAVPEDALAEALMQQMALNLFAWLVPIALVVGAVIYLALRYFVRRDQV